MTIMRTLRRLAFVAAAAATFYVGTASAGAAITITRAELKSGQLRVEGGGALPNAAVTVDPGGVSGTSGSDGSFRIERSGYSSSTCRVTVADSASSTSASLSGCTATTTSAPAVALSPTSLTFAARDTGTTSDPQLVTVTNTGTASLFVNGLSLSGDALDFTIVGDGCSGLTLAVGTSCSVSIVFGPTLAGTRTAQLVVADNAPNSPQKAALTGTGTTPPGETAPALAFDTRFFACTGDVCDVGAGSSVFVDNFFTTSFRGSGGTPPYRFSGALPAGMTLRPSGLGLGAPSVLGAQTFRVTVADATGATATATFSLTPTSPPPPSPSGCRTGGTLKEQLNGATFNGKTPSGEAVADETRFSGCGGFSLLSVQVKNVSLPDGSVLWVTLDFMPIGTIALRGGSGRMATYNLGRFGVSNDDVRVYSALPDVAVAEEILIGGFFR